MVLRLDRNGSNSHGTDCIGSLSDIGIKSLARPRCNLSCIKRTSYAPHMFELTLIDWIGVLGSFMIAGAHLAVSRSWVDAEKPAFHLLNLAGSLMILASLYFRPNAGAIMIEVLWAAIAIMSLFRWWSLKP